MLTGHSSPENAIFVTCGATVAYLEKFWFSCEHCQKGEPCPIIESLDDADTSSDIYRGARLVLPALLVFVLPLLTGIAGSYLAAYWWARDTIASVDGWQSAGLIGGLVVGILVAKIVLGLAGYRTRKIGDSRG